MACHYARQEQFGFFRCADRERGRVPTELVILDRRGTASYTAILTSPQKKTAFMELSYDQAQALAAAGGESLHARFFAGRRNRKWWFGFATTFKAQLRGTAHRPESLINSSR